MEDLEKKTTSLLQASAKEKNIELLHFMGADFDFTKQHNLNSTDFFYRISLSDTAKTVEHHLLANTEAKSFYKAPVFGLSKPDNVYAASLLHQKYNVPIIPTLFSFTNNRELLQKYAKTLGDFPLILKATGGSHGVGVIKVDSIDALLSLADYLMPSLDQTHSRVIMRKFIKVKQHARLIVLGQEVVSSIEYYQQDTDFRTNVGDGVTVGPQKFGSEVEKIACQAVEVLGWEFGGVDILIDQENQPWIAEVNLPCYFPRAQEITHDDISGKMLEYALAKTQQT